MGEKNLSKGMNLIKKQEIQFLKLMQLTLKRNETMTPLALGVPQKRIL
jgi:hypothetical protein